MSKDRTAKWGVSPLCAKGEHGWCMNRSPVECHCSCPCHASKVRARGTDATAAKIAALHAQADTLAAQLADLDAKLTFNEKGARLVQAQKEDQERRAEQAEVERDTLAARVRELEADILLLRADPACYYAQERDRVDRSGSPAERTP